MATNCRGWVFDHEIWRDFGYEDQEAWFSQDSGFKARYGRGLTECKTNCHRLDEIPSYFSESTVATLLLKVGRLRGSGKGNKDLYVRAYLERFRPTRIIMCLWAFSKWSKSSDLTMRAWRETIVSQSDPLIIHRTQHRRVALKQSRPPIASVLNHLGITAASDVDENQLYSSLLGVSSQSIVPRLIGLCHAPGASLSKGEWSIQNPRFKSRNDRSLEEYRSHCNRINVNIHLTVN